MELVVIVAVLLGEERWVLVLLAQEVREWAGEGLAQLDAV